MASADPLVRDASLGLACGRTTTDESPTVGIIWILLGCWYLGRAVSGGLSTAGRAEDWAVGENDKSMTGAGVFEGDFERVTEGSGRSVA